MVSLYSGLEYEIAKLDFRDCKNVLLESCFSTGPFNMSFASHILTHEWPGSLEDLTATSKVRLYRSNFL